MEYIAVSKSVTERRIVAFAKDWDDVPTCITHVLRGMGTTMPVLWLNSLGARRPNLHSSRDLRRMASRIGGLLRRSVWAENQIRVLKPLVIPKANTWLERWVNRRLMTWYARREGFLGAANRTELWTVMPNTCDFLGCFGEQTVVYYCPDDWSKFEFYDSAWVQAKENELLQRANVVFATSRFLEQKCRTIAGDRVHYMPHGVEHAKFARALDPNTAVPDDMAALPKPVIGFYGTISSWIDFELILNLAVSRPHWSFAMIGPVKTDVSQFADVGNVHFMGRREHDELPAYCKGFAAAMIPYNMNDPRMESVNPVKARELLAAGVPIVASELPELEALAPDVLCVNGLEAWGRALELQIAGADRQAISARRNQDDWTRRVQRMREIVEAASDR